MNSTKTANDAVIELVSLLPSTKEASLAKQSLRHFRDTALYQASGKKSAVLVSPFGLSTIVSRWIQHLDESLFANLSVKGWDDLIAFFEKSISGLGVVPVTFAAQPSVDELMRYHAWLDEAAHTHLLFDISIDPAILGGFTMMFNNHFLDYSLASQLSGLQSTLIQRFEHELEREHVVIDRS